MTTEFNPGGAASLDAAVKARYEANENTNPYTDAEKAKLAGVALQATKNTGALANLNTVGAAQIDNKAVTLAKMADFSADRILGRITSAGVPQLLTATQVRTLLGVLSASTLASNANGDGASRIAIEDAAEQFEGASNLEEVLIVIASWYDDLSEWAGLVPSAFLTEGDITERLYVQNAGGAADVARVSSPNGVYFLDWFEIGYDKPLNAQPADLFNLPDGLFRPDEKSANYTFADSDRGKVIFAMSGDLTFTIADEATVPIKYGDTLMPWIGIVNRTGNDLTIQADTSVDLDGVTNGTITIPAKGSGFISKRRGTTDDWLYTGDAS